MISPEQIFASVNYTTSEKAGESIAVQDSGKCGTKNTKNYFILILLLNLNIRMNLIMSNIV